MIAFDELTHFTRKQFFYMMSRNRSVCGVRPYMRATCNPDPDSFVAKFIEWWMDDAGFPIPERSGVIRYFVVINDEVFWANSRDELAAAYAVNPADAKSFTFIASSIFDNRILLAQDPGYLAKHRRARALAAGQLENQAFRRDVFQARAGANRTVATVAYRGRVPHVGPCRFDANTGEPVTRRHRRCVDWAHGGRPLHCPGHRSRVLVRQRRARAGAFDRGGRQREILFGADSAPAGPWASGKGASAILRCDARGILYQDRARERRQGDSRGAVQRTVAGR